MTHLSVLFAASVLVAGPWRTYEVYQPRIERHFVIKGGAHDLKYNHCSSIAWFKDRWFCVWNGNYPPVEGAPGQLVYMSTSPDGKTWSPPEPAFSDERHSTNPIPCPKGTQWQPNLIVVGNELWAVWCQNSKDEHNGCYVSRLDRPDGRWTNRLLKWNGDTQPEVDGKRWRVFPTQNPVQLRSGRILAPVTLIGPKAADAPLDMKSWWGTEKRDSVLYSDDTGAAWHVSAGAIQPGRSWAQWEPTVWEPSDGTVMMFSRNNDFRDPASGGMRPAEAMQWSLSKDGGATWTPHQPVPIETVCSRMHVLPAGGNRWMMAHCDWPASAFSQDRYNAALFFTRGAGIDFVAGPGFSGMEHVVAYPQMCVKDNTALISHTQAVPIRSIKVVHVSPLPDPERYYLFPRSNRPPSPMPQKAEDAWRFDGGQWITGRKELAVGANGFSAGAWVRPSGGGTLLDTRPGSPACGVLWGLTGTKDGLAPFLFLFTPERHITPRLTLRAAEWNYVGVTVDCEGQWVDFHVNGRTERVSLKSRPPHPLQGASACIGGKRSTTSRVPGLQGDLRALAVFPSAAWRTEEHNWLHNRFAPALKQPLREPAAEPEGKPALWFDSADPASIERDFVFPSDKRDSVELVTRDGRQVLCLSGEASAGVDLDENVRSRGDRVEFAFRFRIENGEEHVLCTVGDAVHPARIIARGGGVFLHTKEKEVPCGPLRNGEWNEAVISTVGDRMSARMNGGEWASVEHHPVATWLYVGQGYRTGAIPSTSGFLIDLASVRSSVSVQQAKQ
ncbi:MAG: exo-alpha-sialidase [Planctomycetota bacterium]